MVETSGLLQITKHFFLSNKLEILSAKVLFNVILYALQKLLFSALLSKTF